MFTKAWINGQFNSKESFQHYIHGFGIFAPLILTLFQAVRVVACVVEGKLYIVMICLMLSGVCDMFDSFIVADAIIILQIDEVTNS